MSKDVKENEAGTVGLNPNMNVQGMGAVELPGDPGSANSFATDLALSSPSFKRYCKTPIILAQYTSTLISLLII